MARTKKAADRPSSPSSSSQQQAQQQAQQRFLLAPKSNAVEQLSLLRNFVGSSFSERQLTDSLKKCYYNVESAAELLLTGAVPPSSSNTASSQSSTASGTKGYRSRPRAPAVSDAATSSKSSSYAGTSRRSPPEAPTRGARPKDPPRGSSGSEVARGETIVLDDSDDEEQGDAEAPQSSENRASKRADRDPETGAPKNAASITLPALVLMPSPNSFYLLCERWVSDGFCTSRHGRVGHREAVDFFSAGNSCVRFRSRCPRSSLEGRLADGLSSFLAGLMAERPDPPVRLEGAALMELDQLVIGAQVPLAIKVWVNPMLLFRDDPAHGDDGDERLLDGEGDRRQTKRGHELLLRSSRVFRLLQWAEHGEVLAFEPPPPPSSADAGPSVGPTRQLELDMSSSSGEDDNRGGAAAAKELAEEDFEGDDADIEEDDEVTSTTSEWARNLPEAEDPENWREGVSLRPYQRQALHWMLEREGGTSREEWEKQLAMVAELGGTRAASAEPASQAGDVACDCGPVLVSDRARALSRTVAGEVNPVRHPLWKQRFLATPDLQHTLCFFVNEVLQIATHRPPPPPTPCSGGILADSMGLGKTVMLLALILKSKEIRETAAPTSVEKSSTTTTLVVAKLSLLAQWEEEIKSKTALTYSVYYGPQANRVPLSGVDVVITTYSFMSSNPQLLQNTFLRVILDEAHCVKNHATLVSKVCCKLQAHHRWCVSGTILQNSLNDVYGIMRFLKHEPWCHSTFWKTAVTNPSEKEQDGLQIALDRVRRLLSPLMLRRTKSSLASNGKPILTLPAVETRVISVELSSRERDFYDAVLARSMEIFDGFVSTGVVHKSYFQIFSLLQRLRQVCDHMSLTIRSRLKAEDDEADERPSSSDDAKQNDAIGTEFLEGLLSRFCSPGSSRKRSDGAIGDESPSKRQKENYLSQVANSLVAAVRTEATHAEEECPICLDKPKLHEAVITPCGHIFCGHCLVGYLQGKQKKKVDLSEPEAPEGVCPCCNEPMKANQVIALEKSKSGITTSFLTDTSAASSASLESDVSESKKTTRDGSLLRQILREALDMESSSKMNAIFQELDIVWNMDPGSKVLIFSHYLGFLDLLEARLRREGVEFFRLDGSLNLKQRSKVLDAFRICTTSGLKKTRGSVLLMSMAAGGEGLNLTAASTCFLCEPWWNSAKEDQCVSRISRIGQQAQHVKVRKFIVVNSVEERIVELQQRKAYMADEIYSEESLRESSAAKAARLTLEEFRHLFRK